MAYRETEKVRQRKQEARNRILECAYACVAEGGFRSAQITAVASRAGIATGTIYRYFEGGVVCGNFPASHPARGR